jgi:hypothetical protein
MAGHKRSRKAIEVPVIRGGDDGQRALGVGTTPDCFPGGTHEHELDPSLGQPPLDDDPRVGEVLESFHGLGGAVVDTWGTVSLEHVGAIRQGAVDSFPDLEAPLRVRCGFMLSRIAPHLLGGTRPRPVLGVLVAVGAVAVATILIYPLKSVAPTLSLGVVYLVAVVVVSAYWGFALGLSTSLLSAAAFNYFHLAPVGKLTLSDHREWVALTAFVSVAAVVSAMAELARTRQLEAEQGGRRDPKRLPAAQPGRILFTFMAGALSQRALDAALRLARAEDATLVPRTAPWRRANRGRFRAAYFPPAH